MKLCAKCGQTKPLEDFREDKRLKSGRRGQCRECDRAYGRRKYHEDPAKANARTREWRAKNAAKYADYNRRYLRDLTPEQRRNYSLQATYGITAEEYDAMLSSQGGVCAICRCVPGRQRLAVDHCHHLGVIRGLLCSNCNNGLGRFGHNSETLARAITYIEAAAKSRRVVTGKAARVLLTD